MKVFIRIIFAAVLMALMTVTPVLAAGTVILGTEPVVAISPNPTAPYVSPSDGVSPNADGTTAYTLTEPGITVNIPNDLYVFTRNMTPDNTNPAAFGLNAQDFINYFQAHDTYLNAISSQVSYELHVTMVETPDVQKVNDFNRLTDSELTSFIQNSSSLYQIADGKYGVTETYTGNKGSIFLRSDFSIHNSAGNETYGLQYFTIHDGKAINVYLTTYSTDKVAELTPMLTHVVESTVFAKETVLAPQQSPSAQPSAVVQPSANAQPSTGAQTSTGALPSTGVLPSADASSGPVIQLISGLLGLIGKPGFPLLGIYLAATFVLVTFPMLIYRFAIRKSPLGRGRAAIVAAAWGLIIAAVGVAYFMFFKGNIVVEAGVILWSVVNYFVLTRQAREKKEEESASGLYPIILADQIEKRQMSTISNMTVNKTCKNCFAVNLATSKVCFYCGAKLEDDDEEIIKFKG